MSSGSLTEINGIGPKTAEDLRDDGFEDKEDLIDGFKQGDPAVTDSNARVVKGIREELLDRGETFRDPKAGVEVGPENRNAFETFADTSLGDLDSVDTRYSGYSSGTSLASVAPDAASGELGQRGSANRQGLMAFAADAAANLGLSDMSATRMQEMNRQGTSPDAARLGAPRPEDPFGVTVASDPPTDLTNPERLEPQGLSIRERDEPGEKRRAQFTNQESMAAQSAIEYRNVLDTDDDLDEKDVEDAFFTLRDERDEDGTVELTPKQATTLSTAVSTAARSDKFTERSRVQRGTEDIEGAERIAAAADPTTDVDADRVDPILAARFDAEPAALFTEVDRRAGGTDDASEDSDGRGMELDAEPPTQLLEAESATEETGSTGSDTITIASAGTTTAEVPAEIAGLEGRSKYTDRVVFEGDGGERVAVSQSNAGANRRRRQVTISGEGRESETLAFGAYADRGLGDLEDEAPTLIREFAGAGGAGGRGMAFDAEPPVQLLDADSASADNRDPPTFTGPTSRRPVPESERDEMLTTRRGENIDRRRLIDTPLATEDFGMMSPVDTPGISDDAGSIGTTREEDPDRNVIAGALSAAQGGRSSTQTGGINFGATPAVQLLEADSATDDTSLRDTSLIRVEANGRFNRKPVTNARDSPGARALGNGRYIGGDYVARPDPGAPIKRDPQTGQYVVVNQ